MTLTWLGQLLGLVCATPFSLVMLVWYLTDMVAALATVFLLVKV
jgi:hypothetical protein